MLVRLILTDAEARTELLPLIEPDDIQVESLRTILDALRRAPDAPAESLLTALNDAERSALTALLLEEDKHFEIDPRDATRDFRKYLDRQHRLRKQRLITTAIQEGVSSKEGAAGTPFEEFVALHSESKVVYGIAGGVAQSLEHGPRGPQGVETND